jgi:hypothetical protein
MASLGKIKLADIAPNHPLAHQQISFVARPHSGSKASSTPEPAPQAATQPEPSSQVLTPSSAMSGPAKLPPEPKPENYPDHETFLEARDAYRSTFGAAARLQQHLSGGSRES